MGENVYYPGTFPWEGGVSPQVGRIPQPKVTASAKWSSPTRDPHLAPIPASSFLSSLLLVQDGKSHPHHYSWEIPHLLWLYLYPVPTFINSLFIKLSSNYPISVGHLFSARIASHNEGMGWGLWLHQHMLWVAGLTVLDSLFKCWGKSWWKFLESTFLENCRVQQPKEKRTQRFWAHVRQLSH